MAKNNGIPIEEFDLTKNEESTSATHEESQLKTVEVNTDKRNHAIRHKLIIGRCRLQKTILEIIDAGDDDDDEDDEKRIINFNELEDLIDCEKELKLNDPLLSSFQLFDSPPSSSHSNSIPSSPSSISTVSSTSKRSKSSKQSPFEMHQSSDDDFDAMHDTQRRRKKNKYYNSSSDRTSALNLKDPMMSASHSPSHFSNDLNNYMDHMFFSSSQYLSTLSADDSIDLCTILKTEYDNEISMIG